MNHIINGFLGYFKTRAGLIAIAFGVCLLILALVFGGIFQYCGNLSLRKLGNTANQAAENQKILEGERKQINTEANRDLEEIRGEKEKSNENINTALSNVNNIRNSYGNHNFSADELERLANARRGRK